MNGAGWTLSIDFGTTNTVAAVRLPGGEVRSVRLSSDADQMPSCVFVEDQAMIVGQPASMRAQSEPTRFESNPKRRIGDDTARLGQRTVAVVELVAAVLRHAASRAAATVGGTAPTQVVLTHPEAWARQRLGQLTRAAELAGLGRVRLLPEPVAAAMWYLRATRLPPGGRVAVFDFGGGTCDAAVLRAEPGSPFGFAVLSSGGEDQLGGEHIDRRLLDWVDIQLRASGRADMADQLEDPAEIGYWLTLRDQVRAAKHALSEYPSAHIAVRTATGSASLLITVEEFERLIAQDVDRAVALAKTVLDEAGPEGLSAFYLTGGTSMVPLVQRRITALLGRTPSTLDDPKLVVALGAASGAPATARFAAGTGDQATVVTRPANPVPANPVPGGPVPGGPVPGAPPSGGGPLGSGPVGGGPLGGGTVGGGIGHPAPGPRRNGRRLLVAGVAGAVLLLSGVGVGAFLLRESGPTTPTGWVAATSTTDPPTATTAETSDPPLSTTTASTTITLPDELAAAFPDLTPPASGSAPSGVTCAVREPGLYPNAGDGEKPIFVVDCSYAGKQGSVGFIQWANLQAGPRFIADLRETSTPEEEFTTWDLGGQTQGAYLATQNSADSANPYYLWATFERRPCTFVVSAPTLELANTLYSAVTIAPEG